MDRRGIAESIGAALVSGTLTASGFQLAVGAVDWVLVVGVTVAIGIAAAANYRARTGHAKAVASTAPEGSTQARHATGDGETEPVDQPDNRDTS